MSVIAFYVIGLVVGLIARFAVPARMRLGLLATCLLGMVGALLGGGVIGSFFDPKARPFELAPVDITLAVVFACLFIIGVGIVNSRRAHA